MSYELFQELENMRAELAVKKAEYARYVTFMEIEIENKKREYDIVSKSKLESQKIIPRYMNVGQSDFDAKTLKGIINCYWRHDDTLICDFKAYGDRMDIVMWQKRLKIICTFDVYEFQQFIKKVKDLVENEQSTNSQTITWHFNNGDLFSEEVNGYFVENGRWVCRGSIKNMQTSEMTVYMETGTVEQLYHHLLVIGYMIGIVSKKDLPKNDTVKII